MSKRVVQKPPTKAPVQAKKAPAPKQKTSQSSAFLWPAIASIAVLGYGLYRAIDLRWICDDAFITMRYVKNFVEGNGLVYNIGERVEGYTHFLWLMILAGTRAIGFDPVESSQWLGIAAYAGILVLLLLISFREYKKSSSKLWLPVGAALFALNYDMAVWASGGLETSLYALLILSAFYLWFYTKFPERTRLLLVGSILLLTSLTRPDGVLFTATALALLIARGIRTKQSFLELGKSFGLLILPSIVIGVPYLLWKLSYYGDILPLTYYAKSANENYFGQGFFYIWLYFRVYFISGIALIAGAIILLWPRTNGEGTRERYDSPSITALVVITVYLLLFVARVGGDFMFARFMVPIVPFVYLVIERAVNRLPITLARNAMTSAHEN